MAKLSKGLNVKSIMAKTEEILYGVDFMSGVPRKHFRSSGILPALRIAL